jgi:hypothetical protein
MANRYLEQFTYSMEKKTVRLFGSFVIGAAGAVGTVKGGGIKSVVKEATAGQYSITLNDKWSRLLHANGGFVGANPSGVASVQVLENPANLQSDFAADSTYKIQFYDFAGDAVDAASGSVHSFEIVVRNSSVGAWD